MRLPTSFWSKQGAKLLAKFLRAALLAGLLLPAAHASTSEVDPVLRERLLQAINESDQFEDKYDAQVWLTDMAGRLQRRVPDPVERIEILTHAHREATRADLPPELVLAVIDIESAFDRFAISRVGARGLMQVMPFWLDELDRPDDNLFDIETNLRFGCTILRYYLDMENGRFGPALARYNGSTGKTWYPDRVMTRLNSRWFQH